ncbi:MAG: hypothetical protein M1819_002224 [Sarea resinae]|nr:MAG: hypothetical protein M1819_002224 [Sarea resinae]
MAETSLARVTVDDGISIFYRTAGSPKLPVLLLLHGFPSSSHQFRNLIPLLAPHYHILAPDLPGFGFTVVPPDRHYAYTFANLSKTTRAFLDALDVSRFAVYIFDYGAPTALRLALDRPDAIAAIVTQNGNAYEEGLGADFWAPLQKYWASDSASDRNVLREAALTFSSTKWQYVTGSPHPDAIPPETYHLDFALLARPGNPDIQLDLFRDYKANVALYPRFHEYFRRSKVPVLAVWGKNDPIFVPAGAEAYRRDVSDLEIHYLDASHFAIETNEARIADLIVEFLRKRNLF